jgi:hypothetical protein
MFETQPCGQPTHSDSLMVDLLLDFLMFRGMFTQGSKHQYFDVRRSALRYLTMPIWGG